MEVPVNYLAVIAAAVSNMVLGFLWFGPLFGKQWKRLSGITDEKINEAKAKGMAKNYAIAFVSAFVSSYVMHNIIILSKTFYMEEGIRVGLTMGFFLWLGFMVPVTLASVLWDSKPWSLWLITSSYYLVSLLVMGSILAVWT